LQSWIVFPWNTGALAFATTSLRYVSSLSPKSSVAFTVTW